MIEFLDYGRYNSVENKLASRLTILWVETCYIDEYNPVEHAEAISFMFKWYQEASTE